MPRMHRHRIKGERLRLLIQLLTAAILNGYAAGFFGRRIFTGGTKRFCVPVLNCYSCPGALGACPIGALQTFTAHRRMPFYVLGTLMLFGTLLGRLLCGFFCPFGLIQDLLHRIPTKKLTVPKKADRILRYFKYAVLLIFVILLPVLFVNALGTGKPWFCQYICPAGTLEGGIPLVLLTEQLREQIGGLFFWKLALLTGTVIGAVYISRFFCRYVCPLGALYALFNRFSAYQMAVDSQRCTGCGACSRSCPMALDVPKEICSGECIRCGRCRQVCPESAVSSGLRTHEQKTE